MNVKCRTRPSLARVWVWACTQAGSPGAIPKSAPHHGQLAQETPHSPPVLSPCLYLAVPFLSSKGAGSWVGGGAPSPLEGLLEESLHY